MQKRSLLALTTTLIGASLASGTACSHKTSARGAFTQAQIEANEAKVENLERRLQAIETKTAQLDDIALGVKQVLKRLDEGTAANSDRERRLPSPSAIYSMPITGDPYIGPEFAKVTMVKGYDFYCGYCDKVLPTVIELKKRYGADLKIVFKNFAILDFARLPALAACAANKQKQFMPMFEQIWIHGLRARNKLDESQVLDIADKLRLNRKRFLADLYGFCEDKVHSDFLSMDAVGATGTPVFYINGRYVAGALPIEKYAGVIDQEIAKADRVLASGTKLKDYYQNIVKSGKKSI